MPKGRPKKGGRVVTENVKVTKPAHTEMQEVASVLRLTMSQVARLGARRLKQLVAERSEESDDLFEAVNLLRSELLEELGEN